jgi:hypothetical protein
MKRLERLEAAALARRGPPSISPLQRLLMMLLAYHRGAWQEGEPPIAAWGRALGYEFHPHLMDDLRKNSEEVSRRDMQARRDLCAAHGVDLGSTSRKKTAGVIAHLIEQVPEDLRARFGIQDALDAWIGADQNSVRPLG